MTTIIRAPGIYKATIRNGSGPGGGTGGVGKSLVITTGQTIPVDVGVVYFTPPSAVIGYPEDFDNNQAGCEAEGFLYDNGDDTCGVNGSKTTYFVNNDDITLTITNEEADKSKWLINESATNTAYVSAFYGVSSYRAFSIAPLTSILIQKVNGDWRLLERIDNAGGSAFATSAELRALLSDETGTGVAVFATAPTLENPHMSKGITYQGIGYTPAGSTQDVDLAYNEIQLNLTAGSGTLTATLLGTASKSKGNIAIKQHAVTQRGLTIASALPIAWYGSIPNFASAPVNSEWNIPFQCDGTKIKLQGETTGATDLTVTRTTETVTVESSSGTDAVLPTVTTSLAGVLSSGKYNDFSNTTNLLDNYAMLVGTPNGWCSATLMEIAGGEGDWTDPGMDNWPLGYWQIEVSEGSGNVASTILRVDPINGAYFSHDGVSLGVRHNIAGGFAEYVVGDPSLFRTAIGLGSMALAATSSYVAVAGSTMTGALVISRNGAVSSPTATLTGTWYSGGSGTTTKPHVLVEPSGTTSTSWSTSGTGLGVNAASGFVGNLIDLKTNNTSRFVVDYLGAVTASTFTTTGNIGTSGASSAVAGRYFADANNNLAYIDTAIDATHGMTVVTRAATRVPLTAKGAVSQTANTFEVQNSGGTVLTAFTSAGNLSLLTVGGFIQYKSGTGQRAGNATLVAGTVTVTNTTVTANTVIVLTRKTAGGTLGNLTYTLSAGASFTISSTDVADTSVISYQLLEVV